MNFRFCMLVGLPGSGKSYNAKKLAEEWQTSYKKSGINRNVVRLSSDEIRKELFGSETIQKNPEVVFRIMGERTRFALEHGDDVIYDACNIESERRREFLESISGYSCDKICYIVATPCEVCKNRNRMRDRIVPEEVIDGMYQNWQTPCYDEGWDMIIIKDFRTQKRSR